MPTPLQPIMQLMVPILLLFRLLISSWRLQAYPSQPASITVKQIYNYIQKVWILPQVIWLQFQLRMQAVPSLVVIKTHYTTTPLVILWQVVIVTHFTDGIILATQPEDRKS